jgi:hypothetical protein
VQRHGLDAARMYVAGGYVCIIIYDLLRLNKLSLEEQSKASRSRVLWPDGSTLEAHILEVCSRNN